MNLLPFNIALVNYKSDSIVTRSGIPVRIICTDNEGPYPIIGLFKLDGDICATPHQFTKEGKFNSAVKESEFDLFILGDDKSDLFTDIEDCLTKAFQNIQEFYQAEKTDLTAKARVWANRILTTTLPEGSIVVTPEHLKEFERELKTKCYDMYDRIPSENLMDGMSEEAAKGIVKCFKEIVNGRAKTEADTYWPR